MRDFSANRLLLILPALLLTVHCAFAGQIASTSSRGMPSVSQAAGISIVPAGTGQERPGDLAPPQFFEIIRPQNQAITIGRIYTSCTCVVLDADKRSFAAGERAVFRLRNTYATPPTGMEYAIYIQITSPINAILRADTFVRSSQFVPSETGMPPTRGNIKIDGVYTGTTSPGIEVIIPKADSYIPDTSEYTKRKQAEALATESKMAEKKNTNTEKDTAQSGVSSETKKPTKSNSTTAAGKTAAVAASARPPAATRPTTTPANNADLATTKPKAKTPNKAPIALVTPPPVSSTTKTPPGKKSDTVIATPSPVGNTTKGSSEEKPATLVATPPPVGSTAKNFPSGKSSTAVATPPTASGTTASPAEVVIKRSLVVATPPPASSSTTAPTPAASIRPNIKTTRPPVTIAPDSDKQEQLNAAAVAPTTPPPPRAKTMDKATARKQDSLWEEIEVIKEK